MYGIPGGEEADGHDGEEDDDDVPGMHADRIGVDDEGPFRRPQRDEAILLLQPAEQETDKDADDGTEHGDEPAFEEKDV